jgi:hypothetical protein
VEEFESLSEKVARLAAECERLPDENKRHRDITPPRCRYFHFLQIETNFSAPMPNNNRI